MDVKNFNLPVLILTPGRSATHTIGNTLNHNGIINVNFHSLPEAEFSRGRMKPGDIEDLWYRRYVTRRMIDLSKGNSRWKIITLVREPVANICSRVFKGLDLCFPQLLGLPDEQKFEGIMECLHDHLVSADSNANCDGMNPFFVNNWFDKELKGTFEFDIFSIPVNRNADFQIYETKHADILMIKVGRLSDCFQQALSPFLGRPITQLYNSNMAWVKSYAQMYDRVKKTFKLPLQTLEYIYSQNQYIRHFYSDDQIAGFIRRWADMEKLSVKQDHTVLSVAK